MCDFIEQHLAATDVTESNTKFSLHRELLKVILAAFRGEESLATQGARRGGALLALRQTD